MKTATATVSVPVRIQLNTVNAGKQQWARIIDKKSGVAIHTGQPSYIKRVAKKKFNLSLMW